MHGRTGSVISSHKEPSQLISTDVAPLIWVSDVNVTPSVPVTVMVTSPSATVCWDCAATTGSHVAIQSASGMCARRVRRAS